MNWRSSLETYAPWAHAWLFARTGDFSRAQSLMAEALQRGFGDRRRRYFLTASVRTRLKTLERCLRETCDNQAWKEPPATEGSFPNSPKLLSLQRVVEALRSFPARERMAVVLLYVDGVPEDRVCEWLEVDAAYLAEFRTRVGMTLGPDGLERIRHFRISEAFLSSVLTGMDQGNVSTFTLTRVLISVLVILTGATVVFRRGGPGLLEILYLLGIPGLMMSLCMVLGVFWLRWVYRQAAPEGLQGPEPGVNTIGEVATFSAIPVLLAHAMVIVRPELLLRGDPGHLYLMPLDHWFGLAVVFLLETVAVFRLLAHHLPALARGTVGSLLVRVGHRS